MNYFIKIAAHIVMIWIISILSCKKPVDESSGLLTQNRPPVANAGPDQTISLPTDSVELSGIGTDADGNIVSYNWAKVSGPSSFILVNPNAAVTKAKNLAAGLYKFELKVTDDHGLFTKDTVQILVNDPAHPNRPPIARIYGEAYVLLPTDSVYLVSLSSDDDGQIVNYTWLKIAGPGQFNIVNPNSDKTAIRGLVNGIYQFELEVVDDWGLSSRDTTIVTVDPEIIRPKINLQLIPVGTLSVPRYLAAAATVGNKIFFAGGGGYDAVSRVDIYDISSQTWSIAELSEARAGIEAFTVNNKIYFAGGAKYYYDGGVSGHSTRVDIYDGNANLWSTTEAPYPIGGKLFWGPETAVVGSKAFHTDFVFDAGTNSWLTLPPLNIPHRWDVAVASVGNKVFFAGGSDSWDGNRVDIYDVSSNSWSADTLSEERGFITAITMSNKVFFAGGRGRTSSNKIDIYDNATQSWSVALLTQATILAGAAIAGQKILFFGDHRVDIYDASSGTWFVADFPYSLFAVSDNVIAAGGNVYVQHESQVWRIEL